MKNKIFAFVALVVLPIVLLADSPKLPNMTNNQVNALLLKRLNNTFNQIPTNIKNNEITATNMQDVSKFKLKNLVRAMQNSQNANNIKKNFYVINNDITIPLTNQQYNHLVNTKNYKSFIKLFNRYTGMKYSYYIVMNEHNKNLIYIGSNVSDLRIDGILAKSPIIAYRVLLHFPDKLSLRFANDGDYFVFLYIAENSKIIKTKEKLIALRAVYRYLKKYRYGKFVRELKIMQISNNPKNLNIAIEYSGFVHITPKELFNSYEFALKNKIFYDKSIFGMLRFNIIKAFKQNNQYHNKYDYKRMNNYIKQANIKQIKKLEFYYMKNSKKGL